MSLTPYLTHTPMCCPPHILEKTHTFALQSAQFTIQAFEKVLVRVLVEKV